MATRVLRVLDRPAQEAELQEAGEILRRGGLVAFPTETVYGIAVSASHPEAVERLYALKQRDRSKAMTVMVASAEPVLERCGKLTPTVVRLMKRFWPGPLTLVLQAQATPAAASAGRATGGDAAADAHPADPGAIEANVISEAGLVGFRLPSHPLARGLVRAAGVPLLVPSCNRSGEAPATTAEEVLAQFPDQLDLLIDGGPADGGVSSSVVQVVGDEVTVLREGAIPEWRIHQPDVARLLFVCTGNTDRSPLAAAIVRRRIAQSLGCTEDELVERGYTIESAGLAAETGRRASRKVRSVAREIFEPGLDLDLHRSRKLNEAMVSEATRIFCMERAQREEILAFFPHRVRDVILLDPEGQDIEDPAGLTKPTFERLAKRLDTAASLIVASIAR